MFQKDVLIYQSKSIKDALKSLNEGGKKVLLVIDDQNRLLGTITDGDIRRYILTGKSLENNISEVYNRKPNYIKKENYSIDLVRKIFIRDRIDLLPILDEGNKVVDFVTWNEVFFEDKTKITNNGKINIPVVIMAGGKGSRLDPFTKVLPKPLIPIGDKPIIEIIIEEFKQQGANEYFITLNHKSEIIKSYFNGIERDYEIKYLVEKEFLGTAGSLKLLENKIGDLFIVSNCDVIVKADFEDVVSFHKEQRSVMTILSPIQHYKIPYGIVKFKEGGEVESILEKPEYTFTVNAGVYILNKESLQFIPKDSYFDMTDLVKKLIENNKKVMMYPINGRDYVDIGQWEEYKKVFNKL
ncbi:MAG: sugar phosphate nucleotidyltransferase [Candidatus Omnitrophota bacterium]